MISKILVILGCMGLLACTTTEPSKVHKGLIPEPAYSKLLAECFLGNKLPGSFCVCTIDGFDKLPSKEAFPANKDKIVAACVKKTEGRMKE